MTNPAVSTDQIKQALPLPDRIRLELVLLERSFMHAASYKGPRDDAVNRPGPWPRALPMIGRQTLLRRIVQDDVACCILLGEDGVIRQANVPANLPEQVLQESLARSARVVEIWGGNRPLPAISNSELLATLGGLRRRVQQNQAAIMTLRSNQAVDEADRLEWEVFPAMATRRVKGRAVPSLPSDAEWAAIAESAGLSGIEGYAARTLGVTELQKAREAGAELARHRQIAAQQGGHPIGAEGLGVAAQSPSMKRIMMMMEGAGRELEQTPIAPLIPPSAAPAQTPVKPAGVGRPGITPSRTR